MAKRRKTVSREAVREAVGAELEAAVGPEHVARPARLEVFTGGGTRQLASLPRLGGDSPLFPTSDPPLEWSVGVQLGGVAVVLADKRDRLELPADLAALLAAFLGLYARHLELFTGRVRDREAERAEAVELPCEIGHAQGVIVLELGGLRDRLQFTRKGALYAAARITAERRAI